jgi:hypothetical protein
MKTIPLTQGKVALVDDEDYEQLMRYKWQALQMQRKGHPIWYARRMTSLKDGPRIAIYMHREIMNAGNGTFVDHEDFDGLNDQKANLRVCSPSENCCRRRKTDRKKHSKYKGVTWNGRKWMASIKQGTLGYSNNEKDCAIMYNVAAQLFYGAFAHLNDV